VLTPIKVFVSQKYAERPNELCEMLLAPLIEVYENIYSYLIYAEYENKVLTGWTIQYVVSQDEQYNTLKLTDIVAQIAADIIKNNKSLKESYIIGYKQPPLEILCELFDPLMQKLAYTQHIKWPKLEQEDLLQMCRLTMCVLYSKGYYINRRLLEQSFYNAILMQSRKDKNMPIIVSLSEPIQAGVSGAEKTLIEDIVPDYNELYEEQDKEDDEEYQQILEEERQVIIDMIGQRQYDQLIREYGNHCTTCRGQRQVARIKGKLKEDKILKEN
jgi:hypothetical protein